MADDREHEPGSAPSAPPGLSGRDLVGLGGLLVGAVVAGLVIGLLVDDAAGTSPLWTLVGIGLGILAAVVGFMLKVRQALGG